MNADPIPSALAGLNGDQRTEYWGCLALRCAKGLGARSIRRLLAHFGSALDAMNSVPRWGEAGVSPAKGRALSGKEWRALARPEWESSRDLDGRILLWIDERYPPQLRELPDAPALLYARGDLSLLRGPCVAVVGSRACSAGRVRLTRTIAGELADSGITVVSGLARGIDGAAHEAALNRSGGTIAVLGAGLDVIYPPEHLDLYRHIGRHGLLLSEFPPATPPDGRHFPIRNRIISGLSLGVLVMEGASRSGSLVTARLALEQNRAVYAVPALHLPPRDAQAAPGKQTVGQADAQTYDQANDQTNDQTNEQTDGCTLLLEQGARPCLCAADVLADLLPQLEGMASRPPAPACAPPSPRPAAPRIVQPSTPSQPVRQPAKKAAVPPSQPSISPTTSLATSLAAPARPHLPSFPPDSPEGRVLHVLREQGTLLPDEFPAFLQDDLTVGRLSALLLMLEVKGLVRRLPGPRYEAI